MRVPHPSPSHNTSTGSMSLPGGTPARSGWGGVPQPGQDGDTVPPSRSRQGGTLVRSGWGPPTQPGQGRGTPPPPPLSLSLSQQDKPWTVYAAVGTPLAVSCRRMFLFSLNFKAANNWLACGFVGIFHEHYLLVGQGINAK